MTKKSLLTLVSAIFLIFMFVSCEGNNESKEESEKPDTGDTDTPTVPDEDPADTGDAEVVPDEDNTDTGNVTQEGCTIKSSFGTRSVKRDIAETCIKEIAKAEDAECSWNYKHETVTAIHIESLQKLKITFGNECKDKNGEETVECPGFIPETLKLGSLTGCDVYSIDPNTDCIAPCADIYFSTGDDTFHTVYVGGAYGKTFIKSSDSIKEASFYSEMNTGSNKAVFTWSEKAEDGTETEKAVSVEMKVVDSDDYTGEDFEAVDVGECRHEEPAFSFRDRIYTDGSYWCNEYVEVTDKTETSIRFNWFGEMHCGADWEYGYKVEGIAENVLKVRILERDTDSIAADCDNCCYLMPIEYTASSAEEIESIKAIEINYEGKNHTDYFEIN
jgi:hypothetical protein